ncbi:NTP/NDP exchange transporter [Tahibacter caeni]|uniref:NTP/NDP exchange transporter n=1 Tax=Tahibacter caeni TaxID=1453545 RepID=UPI0021480C3C|nr:Npt1/Npt2 family nucleotide transporter [Tahibacter caeni]
MSSVSERLESYLRNTVKSHEWAALCVSAAYFFCVLASYYIIRPVRDQLSAAAGSTQLPIFYLAVFVVTLLLTPVFGALAARFRRSQFVPAVYAIVAVLTMAFIPLFAQQERIGATVLGTLFFIWGSVFNLLIVALFWSFMADIFDRAQARRLFPLIAIGGALGAIAGPTMTKLLVFAVGVRGLLVVSALLLGLCIACIYWLLSWARRNPVVGEPDRDQRVIGGSMIAGAIETLRSPFLRRVALLMLLGDCVGTVIYAFLADYNRAMFPTQAAGIAFASNLDLATNILQILFQLFLTREIMVRLGPIAALVLDGIVKALMLVGLVVVGPGWIVVAAVVTRASAYGIFKPAADSLYTEVDAETRYKAKNFIDTAVWRFGDLAVTSSLNLLRGLGVATGGLALLAALAGVSSAWVGWRMRRALPSAALKAES